ncbi:hypothetical protein QJS66_15435 [Kocuria rhizophila]|nr:hypothetical protein QJS66_15435 [Kocuria rhizophila]
MVEATGHAALPVTVDHRGLRTRRPAHRALGRGRPLGRERTPGRAGAHPRATSTAGRRMPVSRRAKRSCWPRPVSTARWSSRSSYDSELRHTGQPLPALGALDTRGTPWSPSAASPRCSAAPWGVGHLVARTHCCRS